jgi:hypothetical protein
MHRSEGGGRSCSALAFPPTVSKTTAEDPNQDECQMSHFCCRCSHLSTKVRCEGRGDSASARSDGANRRHRWVYRPHWPNHVRPASFPPASRWSDERTISHSTLAGRARSGRCERRRAPPYGSSNEHGSKFSPLRADGSRVKACVPAFGSRKSMARRVEYHSP